MGLLDEMNQYCVQQPKRAKGAGRQLFIAQKAEIQEVINAGYPMTEIWQYLHSNGRMPIVYRVFVEYVHRFITNPQQAEREKGVATKNNGVGGNSTLAARLEKPSSVNTNISEATIAKPERQEKLPRGVGNVPKTEAFGEPIDMTGKFEIDESYITQTPISQKPKFYYDSKAKESIMDSD